jgi:SPP1 family predicted phage head-tail adaptor
LSRKTQLRAGLLRHQIRIAVPNWTPDSWGDNQIDSASVLGSVWASVEALSGRELFAAQQRVSNVTHVVTIRYMDGLKASMNVWFGARQFQIQAIENPDEQTKMLRLLCIERDDSANETPS